MSYSNEQLTQIFVDTPLGECPQSLEHKLTNTEKFIVLAENRRQALVSQEISDEEKESSEEEDAEFLPEKKAILIPKPKKPEIKAVQNDNPRNRAQSFNVQLTEGSLKKSDQYINCNCRTKNRIPPVP